MTAVELLSRSLPARPPKTGAIPLALSRTQLPALCASLGMRRGAEVGVWKGAFTAAFCAAGLHMLAVDPWQSYPAWLDTKNDQPVEQAQRAMEAAYTLARARLAGLKVTILRQFSTDAARSVADGSLDLVYIDANHVEEAVVADLEAWAPKVRSGGIVAGHDYRAFSNKPTIHVIEAVQRYTRAHRIASWYVTARDRTPSFLWVAA